MAARILCTLAIALAASACALAGGSAGTGTPAAQQSAGAAATPGAATTPVGTWLAEDIRGGGVIDRLRTTLEIAADGRVGGSGGCNRMAGAASIRGENIRFGQIAATRIACTPAAMNQESKFFAALDEVRQWRVDPLRRKLVLLDEHGKTLLVLSQD